MKEPRLISTTHALKMLPISKATLYRYEAAGVLQSVQLIAGGKKMWRETDIHALAAGEPIPEPKRPRRAANWRKQSA